MEQQQQNGNGRVSDAQKISNYRQSEEKIIYDNQRSNALKGILENTKLSNLFLSNENTDNIQKQIRYGVYKGTGKVISNQSPQEVSTVMRSIYLQNGSVPVTSNMEATQVIGSLNSMVVDYCVENIVSELKQHDNYIKDISSLPVPIDRPQYDRKNTTYDMSNLM